MRALKRRVYDVIPAEVSPVRARQIRGGIAVNPPSAFMQGAIFLEGKV